MRGSLGESRFETQSDARWRRPAPRAQAAARALYAWQAPGWVFPFSLAAALPFILAAALAPALLSLAPTAQMIAPIADARAIAGGAAPFEAAGAPFYSLLLLAADLFADAPGRIHLAAKAIAAALIACPMAYLASARFPALQAILLAAALAATVTAPFSGPAEIALAIFLLIVTALICAPADESFGRARFESGLAGLGLMALWLLSPAFWLASVGAIAAAPFLTGRGGLMRSAAGLVVFMVLAGGFELAAPGVNLARAAALPALFGAGGIFIGESAAGLGGVAASTGIVILAAAIFGGGEHWRGWGAGAGLALVALLAARLAGANAAPVFVFAAALACFSIASPFYDGISRAHDRASIAVALVAAGLTLFWTASLIVHGSGQLMLQARVAAGAPSDIRAELGLVQPGGPTIANWIEEGRFSTPEARELFALAPVDQSAMLLEAASRAKTFASHGLDVAILAGSDAACVIAEKRPCRASGAEAASEANVVFAPRLDLDPATAEAKSSAEALLYTEFKLVEQTALWDIWVRRGAILPREVASSLNVSLNQ